MVKYAFITAELQVKNSISVRLSWIHHKEKTNSYLWGGDIESRPQNFLVYVHNIKDLLTCVG